VTSTMIPVLFGQAYAAAVPAALVLVVANGINAVNLTLADGLRGLGRPPSILVSETLGLVFTCVLLLVLLRRFGSMGAAITSLVAYGVVCMVLVLMIRRA
jgi:O-antigen/teichoic acid export membrane protein